MSSGDYKTLHGDPFLGGKLKSAGGSITNRSEARVEIVAYPLVGASFASFLGSEEHDISFEVIGIAPGGFTIATLDKDITDEARRYVKEAKDILTPDVCVASLDWNSIITPFQSAQAEFSDLSALLTRLSSLQTSSREREEIEHDSQRRMSSFGEKIKKHMAFIARTIGNENIKNDSRFVFKTTHSQAIFAHLLSKASIDDQLFMYMSYFGEVPSK
ncbi:MAG: hypothetical protein TREMPRED_003711 [Tremellales sp. Tagirdzhanova-0007]|nr:MAG: hypothetical protein TREMPRED_003711 [Tremellales sp. Tagirdzhanova-0007]